jgi:hypothetical protein
MDAKLCNNRLFLSACNFGTGFHFSGYDTHPGQIWDPESC